MLCFYAFSLPGLLGSLLGLERIRVDCIPVLPWAPWCPQALGSGSDRFALQGSVSKAAFPTAPSAPTEPGATAGALFSLSTESAGEAAGEEALRTELEASITLAASPQLQLCLSFICTGRNPDLPMNQNFSNS